MKKNKLIVAALCGALTLGTIGGAYSYYTSISDVKENKFTIVKGGGDDNPGGDIIEPSWDPEEEHNFMPGQEVAKDPQFKNTQEYPVYAYMEVSVPSVKAEDNAANLIQIDDETVATGTDLLNLTGVNDTNWDYLGVNTDTDGTNVYLYGYKTALDSDATTEACFTGLKVPDYSMYQSERTELSVDVMVRSIQTEGQEAPTLDGYAVFESGIEFTAPTAEETTN